MTVRARADGGLQGNGVFQTPQTEAWTNSQKLVAHTRPAQVQVPELWGKWG